MTSSCNGAKRFTMSRRSLASAPHGDIGGRHALMLETVARVGCLAPRREHADDDLFCHRFLARLLPRARVECCSWYRTRAAEPERLVGVFWKKATMDSDFVPLLSPGLVGWRMAGAGGFSCLGDGVVESHGGSGILWYAEAQYGDFILHAGWRLSGSEDNSGIFLRIPPLGNDLRPAIEEGYEAQIDDRGLDPKTRRLGSPLHLTGAIY